MRLRYGPSPPTMVRMLSRRLFVLLFSAATLSCGGGAQDHPWNALDAERPIAAFDSVFIEELTWMEVRDRIAGGATTAIVATGGIEQNGPYVVTGKHNVVLRATTEAIARRLGDALVAPIVKLVPEGDHDPPTGHMRFPGTFSLTPETFEMVLTDVARSLATSGFTDILMIGDSGGNQRGMAAVAERWNAEPPHAGVRLHHILEYYREDIWSFEQLKELGVHQEPDVQSASRAGIHDDYHYDAIMATVDPGTIRARERRAAGLFEINGVSLDPLDQTIANGQAMVARRAEITIEAFRKSLEVRERWSAGLQTGIARAAGETPLPPTRKSAGTAWNADLWAVLPVGPAQPAGGGRRDSSNQRDGAPRPAAANRASVDTHDPGNADLGQFSRCGRAGGRRSQLAPRPAGPRNRVKSAVDTHGMQERERRPLGSSPGGARHSPPEAGGGKDPEFRGGPFSAGIPEFGGM